MKFREHEIGDHEARTLYTELLQDARRLLMVLVPAVKRGQPGAGVDKNAP